MEKNALYPLFPLYHPTPGKTGETGKYRTLNCGCEAKNDYEIASLFMRQWEASPHSYLNYRKEINRFMGWMASQMLALSDVSFEHALDFNAYLASPPKEHVRVGRPLPLNHDDYRPFTKDGLAGGSRRQAIIILSSFYKFLVQQRYSEFNPFATLKETSIRDKSRTSSDDMPQGQRPQDRCIELNIVQSLRNELEEYLIAHPNDIAKERELWLLTLLYMTGARREEVAHGFMADFTASGLGTEDVQWYLRILGKGNKPRIVPAMSELMQALAQYRKVYDLPPLPCLETDKTRPLVMSLSGKKSLTSRMIYQIIIEAFEWYACSFDTSDPEQQLIAEKVRQYSTHWLRHTFATQLMNNGTPIDKGAQILGHSNPATTALYVKESDQANWAEVDRALPRLAKNRA